MVLKVFRWAPGARERMDAFEVVPREGLTCSTPSWRSSAGAIPRSRSGTRAGWGCAAPARWSSTGASAGRAGRSSARLGAVVTVRPLYHFPLIRDLVVDMTPFTARMRLAGAAFVPSDTPEPSSPRWAAKRGAPRHRRRRRVHRLRHVPVGLHDGRPQPAVPRARRPQPRLHPPDGQPRWRPRGARLPAPVGRRAPSLPHPGQLHGRLPDGHLTHGIDPHAAPPSRAGTGGLIEITMPRDEARGGS